MAPIPSCDLKDAFRTHFRDLVLLAARVLGDVGDPQVCERGLTDTPLGMGDVCALFPH